MVFIGKKRDRDAPVVNLGEPRHEEHARHVEPECQQQERLQPVDLARRGAIDAANAAEERIRCDSIHALLSDVGATGA